MPFITEEIRQKLVPGEGSIMVSVYPSFDASLNDERAERVIEVVQQITTHVRNLRAERGLTPADRPRVWIGAGDEGLLGSLGEVHDLLVELARLGGLHFGDSPPDEAHRDVVAGVEVGIVFPEQKLTEEQVLKIAIQIEELSREIENIRRRLEDEKFTSRAPHEVVEKTRQREKEYRSRMETLKRNLAAQG
jgi:valyl-tRNA synthetase